MAVGQSHYILVDWQGDADAVMNELESAAEIVMVFLIDGRVSTVGRKRPWIASCNERALHGAIRDLMAQAETDEIEAVARAISGPCGRCSGRGTERHQLTRDPQDGSADWPCPSCRGGGRTVVYATPEHVARLAVEAMRAGDGHD